MEVSKEGRSIGHQPKPRLLLAWGTEEQEAFGAELSDVAPTIRSIKRLCEVNPADYDVLVTDQMHNLVAPGWALKTSSEERPDHVDASLFVVSFVAAAGQDKVCADRWNVTHGRIQVSVSSGHLSRILTAPSSDDLPETARDLVVDVLLQRYQGKEVHEQLSIGPAAMDPGEIYAFYMSPDAKEPMILKPFVVGANDVVLAGWYQRSPTSEGWILPRDVGRRAQWVSVALQYWSVMYGRFPVVGTWWDVPAWQTRVETTASDDLENLRAELHATSARLGTAIAETNDRLDEARAQARSGARRLLTGKGTPLADSVELALGQLGFHVEDLDESPPPGDGAGRGEDFKLTDPDDPTFDPLVEVKGYDRGARATDLSQLHRHETRAVKGGRTPTALWWVVNHWRHRSPDEREVVLASEAALIEERDHHDTPLVVIDTRDLFHAVRAVEDGSVRAEQVRSSLRSARGRWKPPTRG